MYLNRPYIISVCVIFIMLYIMIMLHYGMGYPGRLWVPSSQRYSGLGWMRLSLIAHGAEIGVDDL